MRQINQILLTVPIALLAINVWAGSAPVTRADVKDWPFIVEKGVLGCESKAVSFAVNGKTYAVNGAAKVYGQRYRWADVREIWADNPAIPGTKISAGALTERGLALCK